MEGDAPPASFSSKREISGVKHDGPTQEPNEVYPTADVVLLSKSNESDIDANEDPSELRVPILRDEQESPDSKPIEDLEATAPPAPSEEDDMESPFSQAIDLQACYDAASPLEDDVKWVSPPLNLPSHINPFSQRDNPQPYPQFPSSTSPIISTSRLQPRPAPTLSTSAPVDPVGCSPSSVPLSSSSGHSFGCHVIVLSF